MSVFWYRIDDQNRFFELMKKNYLRCTPTDRTEEAEAILKGVAKRINFLSGVAIVVNAACVLVWNFMPVLKFYLSDGTTKTEAEDLTPNKILGGWYPFDYVHSPGYEIAFAYEFAICTWSGIVVTLHEVLLAQTVMMLYGQISILAYNLETLRVPSFPQVEGRKVPIPAEYRNNPGPIEYGSQGEIENQMYAQLLRCAKDHQRLMKIADEVKSLYNFVITLQLLTGGLIMIFSAFHFAFGIRDLLFFLKFSLYLAYAMVEIALYCYSGGLLETVSEEVTLAAYSSDWFSTSKRFKNTLQTIMVRNTSPQTLIAGRLYTVNLITLSNLLQLTYSTTALLSRLSDGSLNAK